METNAYFETLSTSNELPDALGDFNKAEVYAWTLRKLCMLGAKELLGLLSPFNILHTRCKTIRL